MCGACSWPEIKRKLKPPAASKFNATYRKEEKKLGIGKYATTADKK